MHDIGGPLMTWLLGALQFANAFELTRRGRMIRYPLYVLAISAVALGIANLIWGTELRVPASVAAIRTFGLAGILFLAIGLICNLRMAQRSQSSI